MSKVFEKLGIYGWNQNIENVLLASFLTGDRALLISQPGAAKTILPWKISKALGLKYAAFDLNAQGFDDILGIINIPKLQEGEMEYVSSPNSIWDKDFVVFEEINRCKPIVQGKALEFLRSGTIGGLKTGNKWCWANMNPIGHEGTNKLTPAVVDRFFAYVWTPDALDIDVDTRALIASSMAHTDAPALNWWDKKSQDVIVDTTDFETAGKVLAEVMSKSRAYWDQVAQDYPGIPQFLATFADFLYNHMKDNKAEDALEPVRLSGRRLSSLRRLVIGYRAVELALDSVLGVYLTDIRTSIQSAINFGIPVGINEDEVPTTKMRNFINSAVRDSYFRISGADKKQSELYYTIFCSRDPLERVRALVENKDLPKEMMITAWKSLVQMNNRDSQLLGFICLQIDAKLRAKNKPPILPESLLNLMKGTVKIYHVVPDIPQLTGQLLPYCKEINDLIERHYNEDPLMGVVCVEQVYKFISQEPHGNYRLLTNRISEAVSSYQELLAKVGI